jgi:hypothetical protein
LLGFEVCDLDEEGFKDFEVEAADIEGFEAVDVGLEVAVLEDRRRCDRDGAIVNSIWSSIKGG